MLWAAADYYRRGWRGVVNRSPNMYTLIGLGVLVSYHRTVCSRRSSRDRFRRKCATRMGMVGVYFEVAAAIVALVLLGEWLELGARGRTSLRHPPAPRACPEDRAPRVAPMAPRRTWRSNR